MRSSVDAYSRISGLAESSETDVLYSNDVEIRQAAADTSENIDVEILVGQKPDHFFQSGSRPFFRARIFSRYTTESSDTRLLPTRSVPPSTMWTGFGIVPTIEAITVLILS